MRRAVSSHHRPVQRTRSSVETVRQNPRSTSSFERRETTWRGLDLDHSPKGRNSIISQQRPKSVTPHRPLNSTILFEPIQPNEIEHLLRSVDRDEKRLVHVDCLGHYRRLVEAIDLRSTPFSTQLLCTLQQRENRIVQRNACRDIRFRSLIDSLEPTPKMTVKKHDFIEFYHIDMTLVPPTLIH